MRRSLLHFALGLVVGVGLMAAAPHLRWSHQPAHTPPHAATTAGRGSGTTARQDVVHVTASGKRYHRAGCRSLSASDTTVTREEAEARGLTPCRVCRP